MPSFLYEDRFVRTLPLTGLFVEHLGIKIEQAGGLTEENVFPTVSQCLLDCGLVEGEVKEKHVVEIITRLKRLEEEDEAKERSEPEEDSGKGKFFAGYLSHWATQLNYVQLCLYAADFDYLKAREYFEKQDQQSIIALAHDKLRFDFERARVAFEAALFGFGGKYKDSPGGDDNAVVIDLTDGGERANRAFETLTKGVY